MVKTILVWTFMVVWFGCLVLAMLSIIFVHRAEAQAIDNNGISETAPPS